jgi:hypothetical protein
MRWTLPLFAIALTGGLGASSLHGLAMPAATALPATGARLPAPARLWPSLLLNTPDSPAVRAWRAAAHAGRDRLRHAIAP